MQTPPEPDRRTVIHVERVSLGFAAAHFNVFDGERELLHGHNYTVGLRVRGPVGVDGTVINFLTLKDLVREQCADLDHRMLVPTRSEAIQVQPTADGHIGLRYGDRRFLFPETDCRLLPLPNTTCECLAGWLLGRLRERLGAAPVELEVLVEEAPGQGARVAEGGSG